jgi:hypothetical protein
VKDRTRDIERGVGVAVGAREVYRNGWRKRGEREVVSCGMRVKQGDSWR